MSTFFLQWEAYVCLLSCSLLYELPVHLWVSWLMTGVTKKRIMNRYMWADVESDAGPSFCTHAIIADYRKHRSVPSHPGELLPDQWRVQNLLSSRPGVSWVQAVLRHRHRVQPLHGPCARPHLRGQQMLFLKVTVTDGDYWTCLSLDSIILLKEYFLIILM